MKPRSFFYTLVALILILVIVGGVGYYYASGIVSRQSQTLKVKLADQQVDDQEINDLNHLKKQYQQLQPYLPLLNEALPSAKKQSEIVLQLNQLAASNGMSLPGVTFSSGSGNLPSVTSETVATTAGILAMPLQVSLTGSYGQMESFLRGLENLGRYVSVSNISITVNKPQNLTFNLSLNAYLKP